MNPNRNDPTSAIIGMCQGKERMTHKQAQDVISRHTNIDKKRGIYHCKVCRCWHVGGYVRKFKDAPKPRFDDSDETE